MGPLLNFNMKACSTPTITYSSRVINDFLRSVSGATLQERNGVFKNRFPLVWAS
jgi:hypothetical protein